MNRFLRNWLVAVLLTLQGTGCAEPPPENAPAPLVPRLAAEPASEAQRLATVEQLLSWGAEESPVVHINTGTDRLPNKLALSMMPIFVDWERHTESERTLRVRNVNVAGNPIIGLNTLATVDVPLDGVVDAEWCLTPPRQESNKDGEGGHGQIRFLFHPDNRPLALDEDGTPLPGVAHLDDLIVSWEAWRPPLVRWTAKEGLDPESYALTLRVYSGAKRFLDDAVRNNPWNCYPLNLPGGPDGAAELLYAGLLMGDALGRRTMREMVESGDVQVTNEVLAEFSDRDLAQAQAVFSEAELPADPLASLIGKADLSYQLIRRSCVTHSLYTVQIGLDRIHKKMALGPAPRLDVVPDELPAWADDLAHADRGKLLTMLPGVLLFVSQHATVLPSQAHLILENQNLVRLDAGGQPLRYYYHRSLATPWGSIRDNMM